MGKQSRLSLLWLLALLWLGLTSATATTFLQFQSTCLGDGWFQYQLHVFDDPFFTKADVVAFGIRFTNQIDQGAVPDNWTNDNWGGGFSDWSTTNGYPSRPYSLTFLVRSSETSYRLSLTNIAEAMILFSLELAEFYPGAGSGVYSANVVGYATMPCLVPCSPEAADGSPPNFVYGLKLLPDVTINRLIQDNGKIRGVDFNWTDESTFVLQASMDLSTWTNIAYIWSWPPETVWTTDPPLNIYGSFYRVALVANGHSSNLPPLSSTLALTPKASVTAGLGATTPRVNGCQFANGKLVVNVTAQPGQTVQVQAMDSHRVVRHTRQVKATGTSMTVDFDAAGLPSPVFFQAVAVPSGESF